MSTPMSPSMHDLTQDPGTNIEVHTFTVTAVAVDCFEGMLHDGRCAILPVSELPPARKLRPGDRVHTTVMVEADRPVVSASAPALLAALYAGVAPEVRTGAVRIVAVARAAGVRSKVAVAATVDGVDPVAALVGREANRVMYVSRLLGGERIDVIPYAEDLEQFARNAMAPAQVVAVQLEPTKVVVSVPAHQMPAAVGGGGLNSHLAGELLGFPVDVVAA